MRVWWCVSGLALLGFVAVEGSGQEFAWLTGKKPRAVELPALFVPASTETLEQLPALAALDLRPRASFEAGHLPGARLFAADLGCPEPSLECLERQRRSLGLLGDEAVLLVSEHGRPAEIAEAFWRLRALGAASVKVLSGGIEAWRVAGLPTNTASTPPSARDAPPAVALPPADAVVVGAEWVRERFGLDGTEIVDLRGEAMWDGRAGAGPGSRRAGHIPHSLPFDFASLLSADGAMPDAATARRTFGLLGPRPRTFVNLDATFVIYGHGASDERLALAYFLLCAMAIDARINLGGMAEWTADPRRPVVRVVDEAEVAALLERENPGLAADRPPQQIALLDVRGEPDFEAGHLPGAINLPAQHCRDGIARAASRDGSGEPSARPLVVYCYGITCIRSRECLSSAGRAGFSELVWFRDGFPVWQQAGLPVLRGAGGRGAAPTPAQ